ncbi:hypothetical protein [Vibrio phage VCPH]|nr:hypothetical protein [Vibrio phage VCPH]
MAVLFFQSEVSAYTELNALTSGADIRMHGETDSAENYVDTDYSRVGMFPRPLYSASNEHNSRMYIDMSSVNSSDDLYIHFYVNASSESTNQSAISMSWLEEGANSPMITVTGDDIYYYRRTSIGGASTIASFANVLSQGTASDDGQYVTIRINHSANEVQCWLDGIDHWGVKNPTTAMSLTMPEPKLWLPEVVVFTGTSGSTSVISQVVVTTNENPVGWKVASINPEATGTENDFGGSVADVNGATPSDASMYLDGKGTQTYQMSDLSAAARASGLVPYMVKVDHIASATDGAVTKDAASAIKVGGEVYGGKITPLELDLNRAPMSHIWEAKPDGSLWTLDDIDNLEAGITSDPTKFAADLKCTFSSASNYRYRPGDNAHTAYTPFGEAITEIYMRGDYLNVKRSSSSEYEGRSSITITVVRLSDGAHATQTLVWNNSDDYYNQFATSPINSIVNTTDEFLFILHD